MTHFQNVNVAGVGSRSLAAAGSDLVLSLITTTSRAFSAARTSASSASVRKAVSQVLPSRVTLYWLTCKRAVLLHQYLAVALILAMSLPVTTVLT